MLSRLRHAWGFTVTAGVVAACSAPAQTGAPAPATASGTASPAAPATPAPSTPPGSAAAAGNPAGLSDEQMVGQLFVAYVYGSGPQAATAAQRAANVALYGVPTPADVVRRWHVGAVMLFDRNPLDPARAGLSSGNVTDAGQVSALTSGLQVAALADAGQPLLIATDQEGGRVQRLRDGVTALPAAAVLARQGPAAIRCAYQRMGRELRALGVNQDYAPVADVVRTATGVIGDRSFGSDAADVASDVVAAVTGLQASGVLATLKHWPGHGGTSTDSHLRLAVAPASSEQWRAVDRGPFAAAAGQAGAVMVGHLAVPAVDPSGLPATLSPVLVRGELRQSLGFGGLVVTDSLWMAPVLTAGSPGDVAVRAISAGNDQLLQSPDLPQAFAALLARVRSDPQMRFRVVEAVQHVLAAKATVARPPGVPLPGC